MDITFSEEQKMIAETAAAFAAGAMKASRARELEETESGFDLETWKEMANLGFAGVVFPEEFGGAGLGSMELGIIVEKLARHAVPSPLFSTVVEAGILLNEAGSPAQRAQWLPRIAAGEALLTAAIHEPDARGWPGLIATGLAVSENGLTLSGTKILVRHADSAEAIICLARSGKAPENLTFVLVPATAHGVRRTRLPAAGGEALWEVTFHDVALTNESVIGQPGQAGAQVDRLLRRGAAFKAAELVGIGDAALELTLDYAKTRIQFGKPIGSFQGVQHHCAEMYRDLEVCRLLTWQATAALDLGQAKAEVAMAKAKTSEAIPALTRIAHQIHGAIGYYRDYPLELYYHRALAAQAAYGNASYHRRLLATDLSMFRGVN